MTTPIFNVTPFNDPIDAAAVKGNQREINRPAFYTLSTPDGQFYAGSTGAINKRLTSHKAALKAGQHRYIELQGAVKDGYPIEVTVQYTPSREEAFRTEQAFLDSHAGTPELLNKALDAKKPGVGLSPSEYNIQRIKETHTQAKKFLKKQEKSYLKLI